MKLQRFFLAAVATFAFVASYAVPCVCVAQTWDYSEAHGKEICDPLPPESYAVFADGGVEKIVDGANLSQRVVASLMIVNTKIENVDFSGSTILGGSFDQAVLVRCNFSGTFLRGGFCDNYTKFDFATNSKPSTYNTDYYIAKIAYKSHKWSHKP
jgi:hypothetical protein